jgi:hypothetical protein
MENNYWLIVQDAYDKDYLSGGPGREGTGLGFFDFANMYFPNPMADGGIVGLAGGGSAGFPPISYPFIDTPEQNLTVGISERQNPFVSYSKQFDIFGGQGGMGIYKEENVPPSVGVQIGRTNDDSQFSAGFNYSPDMGPQAQIEFQKQFPVGGGLNSLFRRK